MTPAVAWTIAIGLAYLFGSLPFGLLTARLVAGIDIRTAGSGNIGATNVARVLGAKWGAFVLLLDGAKGALPVLLLPRWFAPETATITHMAVASGLATIVGHMFPCWLGFRGGKGVATALGVVAVLEPWAMLFAAAAFAVTFAVGRIVSLASIVAAVTFAASALIRLSRSGDPFGADHWTLAAFSLLVPGLIVLRHRTNIVRLWQGTEPKFSAKKPSAERVETASESPDAK